MPACLCSCAYMRRCLKCMSRHARRGMQTGKGLYRVSYVRHLAALTQASHDQESLISWLCRPTLALPRTSISDVTLYLTQEAINQTAMAPHPTSTTTPGRLPGAGVCRAWQAAFVDKRLSPYPMSTSCACPAAASSYLALSCCEPGLDRSLAIPHMQWSLYPSHPSAAREGLGACTWSVRPSIWALEGSFSCSLLLIRDTLLLPDPPGGPSRPEGLLVSWSREDRTVLGVLGAFPVADARLESLTPMQGENRRMAYSCRHQCAGCAQSFQGCLDTDRLLHCMPAWAASRKAGPCWSTTRSGPGCELRQRGCPTTQRRLGAEALWPGLSMLPRGGAQ